MSDQQIGAVEFVRHVRAINRTLASGFTFEFERDSEGTVAALHGMRCGRRVVDTYTVHGQHEAVAARYRRDEYERTDGVALWKTTGGAVDVLDEVLSLPALTSREASR